MATMSELFDGSDPNLVDGGWVSFDVAAPQGCEIVQQYLGRVVIEHSNPPDWAFPTARWRGEKDSAATHWRYVDSPNVEVSGPEPLLAKVRSTAGLCPGSGN